ncbi:MAG: hypothetical protein L0332_10710 [Chloroflexi bacterium]|nr:hypothetical protein [Chloroflexota bacterium]MCI0576138.1 hypothetical protein [Chloroflexota bacterium]MCI0647926.1 hypothetical protein [Chloroflexota bacterium]MCI0727177.1 hypothetical protein [Chloroflexota bacterium]
MANPFTTGRPFISPSLNRLRIIDLPGAALEDSVRGKSGSELLSAAALKQLIGQQAGLAQLPADSPDLLPAFDHCFTSNSADVRAAAEIVAGEYGRHLGYLLLTLKRGDAANWAARPEWEERHWVYWQSIRIVWLGGGLVAGAFGQRMLPYAQDVLQGGGYPEYSVNLSPHGANLPLIGAARSVRPEAQAALVFDFGHTQVKRACAWYAGGALVGLRLFPAVPTPCPLSPAEEAEPAVVQQQARHMVAIMVESWEAARRPPESPFLVSLACYLHQGHPCASHGCYGQLQIVADNLQAFFAAQVSRRLGRPVALQLLHDASAAAAVYAGAERTAVLVLGTHIGIGFPPAAAGLRPVGPQLELVS